jgi:hypothetical protein
VREIKSIGEIFEITLCPIGANAEAMTLAMKKAMEMHGASHPTDVKAREAYLIRKIKGDIAKLEH